jgi:transcriptional regulator with XRE-family HTH domain
MTQQTLSRVHDIDSIEPMTGVEPKSWVEIAEDLRQENGLSQDDLAYEARSHGGPAAFNGAWYTKAKQGKRPATPELLRGVAGALGIPPETFVEYRLAIAREQLDPGVVGLDEAAANLKALAGVVAERGLPGPPPGELERLLRDAGSTLRDRQRGGSSGRRRPGRGSSAA